MRFLHCADLHIGSGGSTSIGEACLNAIADAAIAASADALLIAGDLFDRSARSPQAAESAAAALRRLAHAGVHVFCIDGNHDSFLPGRAGCLAALRQRGLIHLLYPGRDAQGEPHIGDYDGAQGCVAYIRGVRVVGFGFLFESTRRRICALSRELAPYDGFTVGMLHTGVYAGALPLGGIVREDLSAYDGLVDYFALGHRHAREEHANAFNPGALCGLRMNAPQQEHGYYRVDVCGRSFSAVFVPAGAV